MKRLLIIITIISFLSSCRKMNADFEERRQGILKVCPKCTFVMSEMDYYACDTAKQPNIVYKVYFKYGGFWYKASDVDHLIRIN